MESPYCSCRLTPGAVAAYSFNPYGERLLQLYANTSPFLARTIRANKTKVMAYSCTPYG